MRVRNSHRFQGLSRGKTTTRGQMNATERRYYESLFGQKGVVRIWYQPVTLRLSRPPVGQPATYTPDFMVLMSDGTTYIDEVKGTGPDDNASIVRLKCAAEQYSLWTFRRCKERTKNAGGGFSVEEV